MSNPLLLSKLYIPSRRQNIVSRPRLIEYLNDGLHRKLILISASAGFGKTTLISDWIAQCDLPVAWLSLEDGDDDLVRFITYLVAALHNIQAEFGAGLMAVLQSPQPPHIETLQTTLLNNLTTVAGDFILVLDDYHLVDSREIDQFLTFFIDHLPPQMHLVIATREDPDLPLARLRVRGQLTELRASDLRFTPSEAAEFLNRMMGLTLSTEDIAALEKRTEGWIAGLQLAAISLQGSTDTTAFIKTFTGSHHFVLDYLLEEVLQQQTENVQIFLLRTSILNRLSGPLCEALLDRESDSGQCILEYLENANLFVVPLDHERRWYRYHHLFRDILRQRLGQLCSPAEVVVYHLRASRWYEQNGGGVEAFQHAFAAGDFIRAGGLAEVMWQEMENSFQTKAWLGFVEKLPTEAIRVRPVLCSQMARAYMDAGDPESSEACVQDVERCLDGSTAKMIVSDESELSILPALNALTRAYNAQVQGDFSATVKYSELALQLFPENDVLRRAQALISLEITHWAKGNLISACNALMSWMDSIRKTGNTTYVVASAFALADIQVELGHLRDAISTYKQALNLAAQHGPESQEITAHHYLGLALIYHELGQASLTKETMEKARVMGEKTTLVDWAFRWNIGQARLSASASDFNSALRMLEEASHVYVKNPVPITRPVDALIANVYLKQGRLDNVREWVNKKGLSADDEINYLNEFEHLTLARMMIVESGSKQDVNELQNAIHLLERMLAVAEEQRRMGIVIEILLTLARAFQMSGETEKALGVLEKALTQAEPEGYIRVFLDEGEPIRNLLQEKLLRVGNQASSQNNLLRVYIDTLLEAFEKPDKKPLDFKKQISGLVEPLSEREMEVLRLLRSDLSGPDIANQLVISANTFHTHTKNIFRKLDVNTRLSAVRRAEDLKLF